MTTTTTTAKTYPHERAAAKAFALALGIKGAAGGNLYRPRIEHLPLSGAGSVPAEWYGRHVGPQGWSAFEQRNARRFAETADGRVYVTGAEALYEDVKAKSSACYAEYLEALANGDAEAAELLQAKHEGWKVRVFAAYELAFGGRKA